MSWRTGRIGVASVILILPTAGPILSDLAVSPAIARAAPQRTPEPEDEGSAEILVVGKDKSKVRLSGDSLRDAAKAFLRHRATFSPEAKLNVQIIDASRPNIHLWLRERTAAPGQQRQRIDLVQTEQGWFEVPAERLATGDWELRSDRLTQPIKIEPWVSSPGTTNARLRFGDLRLQCRVEIAFARLTPSGRLFSKIIDPCDSKLFDIVATPIWPIARAHIDHPALALKVSKNGRRLNVPLANKAIGNDAIVDIVFQQD